MIQMEKDKIFFGENGLTTTSANHIANMAKEAYQTLEQELSNLKLYTTEVALLGSDTSRTLRIGDNKECLDAIEGKLNCIAQYKSLIAWLREAIKAKSRLISAAENLSLGEIAKALNIAVPVAPEDYERLTNDDIVATWNVKQRNRYYYLDTLCSTFGKYIHPDQTFAREREALCKVISEPNRINGNGRDMVIYTMIPTVSTAVADDTFFVLQNKYREYQAELNSLKHQIELAVQADDREKSLKEEAEQQAYRLEMNEIRAKCNVYKGERVREAQALKIIIPDSLQAIYQRVAQMGKK